MIAADDDIPRPGDLDTDEVSPYRRRAKAVPVRRARWPRLLRVLRIAALAVLIVPPSGYVIYKLALFALSSPRFRISSADDVELFGANYVTRDDVMAALGISASEDPGSGVNIFRLALDNARKQVEAIPWVRSAAIERSYPHNLVVRITERTPLAFVNVAGRIKLIDDQGVVLDQPPKASFDYPVLTGVGPGLMPSDRQARMQLYLDFMKKVSGESASSGWMISEVDLSDVDDLKAIVVRDSQNMELEFGNEEFDERFHNFLRWLTEEHLTPNIVSMDLRYHNQVLTNNTPAGSTKPDPRRTPDPLEARAAARPIAASNHRH